MNEKKLKKKLLKQKMIVNQKAIDSVVSAIRKQIPKEIVETMLSRTLDTFLAMDKTDYVLSKDELENLSVQQITDIVQKDNHETCGCPACVLRRTIEKTLNKT